MQLLKVSLLNSIAVTIKLLTMLGLNKLLAVYVGPAGYALIGQFQNAIQLITSFSSGIFSTGITKYTAEYYESEERQYKLWKTAGTIALSSSLVTSILIVLFNKKLTYFFLHDEYYSSVFICFSFGLVFFVFNALVMSVINGKKNFYRYLIINILSSIFSLFITVILAVEFGLYGVLIGLVVNQAAAFCITFIVCYKAPWFNVSNFLGKLNKIDLINLSKYAAMTIVSVICVPASQMLVRKHIVANFGWEMAGYWDAMIRLSGAYLMFVTTTLSVYYLPRLSELKNASEVRNEIKMAYKILLPVTIVSSSAIYLFRNEIVKLLFAEPFMNMTILFKWQMLGDTFKIISWLLSFIYVAKGYTRLYIISEVTFSFTFYLLVIVLEKIVGLESVSIAHAINYFFYLIFVYVSLRSVRAI